MEANKVVQAVVESLLPQFKELSSRLDRIDSMLDKLEVRQEEMSKRSSRRIDHIELRLDNMDQRLDNLYHVIVRREEHSSLEERIRRLEERFEIILDVRYKEKRLSVVSAMVYLKM